MEYFTVKDGIRTKHIIHIGITIEEEPIQKKKKKKTKYNKEFREKQKKIKANQCYCTDCGSNEYLQVHHIDKNRYNNEDGNLILLCYYCHSKHHKHMQGKNPPKWMGK